MFHHVTDKELFDSAARNAAHAIDARREADRARGYGLMKLRRQLLREARKWESRVIDASIVAEIRCESEAHHG